MPGAEEFAELRALQALAYGRDGGLTDGEAARLQELQGPRPVDSSSRVAEPVEAPALQSADPAPWVAEPTPWVAEPEPQSAEPTPWVAEPVEASPHGPAGAAARHPLLRAPWRTAAAAVVVLICGVTVGGLVFGRPAAAAVALTPAQQESQAALIAEGAYDSGSVRAVAVEKGVVVWTATADEGERTCLILGDGETTAPSCRLTETIDDTGMYATLVRDVDDDLRHEVAAQMLFAASGEPAVAVTSYESTPGAAGIVYANEKETRTAERLSDEGFDPASIWVVVYDGAVPIWTAVERETQQHCLIYDGSVDPLELSCSDAPSLQADDTLLGLYRADASGFVTRYEMRSGSGPSYLVITREGGESGAVGD